MKKHRGHINTKVFTSQGKNGLNSIASYVFRQHYKHSGYPERASVPSIDLWYKKPLFGKVDPAGNAIFLSETNLKQLRSDKDETIFAIDFVADAFTDLQKHFLKASFQRKIKTQNSPYIRLNPESGWLGVNNIYHKYVNALYNAFVEHYLNQKGLQRKIENFDDFISAFLMFMRASGPTFPFTRTNFILSTYCPNTISGFIIDLQKKGCSMDFIKTEYFIRDENFTFFRESAKNFGFMVDKNAPWRLVADVSSPKMRQYMAKYGGWDTAGEMTDTYFYTSYLLDIKIMKIYLIDFYNAYVAGRPYTARPVQHVRKGKPGSLGAIVNTRIKKIFRYQVTQEQVDAFYDTTFWLKIYMTLGMYERGEEWEAYKFNNRLKKVIQAYKKVDFKTALGYINDWTQEKVHINMGKIVANDPANGLMPSVIQKIEDGSLVLTPDPSIKDVLSNYYTPKPKKLPPAAAFSEDVYNP